MLLNLRLAFLFFLLSFLASNAAAAGRLRIAAASNIYPTIEALSRDFASEAGTEVLVTPGASGFLARQIEQGAPYDLFISADAARVQELAASGKIEGDTIRIYARGILVLARAEGSEPVSMYDLGAAPEDWRIALPNPMHAPYGEAAEMALKKANVYEATQPRFVLAENVGQALQYIQTRNVQAAFLPLALARRSGLPHILIDSELYDPIDQSLGVVKDSEGEEEARRFVELLTGPLGRAALEASGYQIPEVYSPTALIRPAAERTEGIDWRPVLLTLRVAASATALSVVFGTLLGYFFGMRRFPGRRWFLAATMLPLVLPPTVLGFYLLVLMGRQSPVGRAWEAIFGEPIVFTTTAAVLAASVSAIPIIIRQLSVAFAATNPEVLEAGRIDGASAFRVFWEIQLPLVRPALTSAATIAFARSVGDFGATLMVAGNIPGETQTASIAIYELMNANRQHEAFVLVLVITLIAVVVLAYLAGRDKVEH